MAHVPQGSTLIDQRATAEHTGTCVHQISSLNMFQMWGHNDRVDHCCNAAGSERMWPSHLLADEMICRNPVCLFQINGEKIEPNEIHEHASETKNFIIFWLFQQFH